MPRFLVTIHCAEGHEQNVGVECDSQIEAEIFAGFLTGRSELFVKPIPETRPPGDVGLVGWCGVCGARIQPPEIAREVG